MVVTRDQVRKIVTSKVEALRASFKAYPLLVEYDNVITVNRSTQTLPFLAVDLVYMDGYQTSLGVGNNHRVLGTLIIEANDKVGQGTSRMNTLVDHFYRGLSQTDSLFPMRLHSARFTSKQPFNGWVAQAAVIPFWYDSQ